MTRVLVSTMGGDGGKSGISQYIINLMRFLPAAAPEMSFDVLVIEGEEDLYVSASERLKAIPIPKRYRPTPLSLIWQQVALPRIAAEYDLVFFPAANRRLSFFAGTASVGTYHDLAILHVPDKYDCLHKFYSLRILPAMARRLDAIITDSDSSKRDLVEYVRVPEQKIDVIPIGVDLDTYCPSANGLEYRKVADTYGICGAYILYISRLEHPGKNHVRIIRAFSEMKNRLTCPHKLVLAGSDWDGAEAVHAEASASPYSKDIIFTGFVPQNHLAHLYRGADLFVFPSLFEGFGLPVLEAMACGVPVACSNTSSLPEIAGDAALYFDPLSESQISDAMRVCLTDGAVRARLAENGRRKATNFTWRETAMRTADVFRRVVMHNK